MTKVRGQASGRGQSWLETQWALGAVGWEIAYVQAVAEKQTFIRNVVSSVMKNEQRQQKALFLHLT